MPWQARHRRRVIFTVLVGASALSQIVALVLVLPGPPDHLPLAAGLLVAGAIVNVLVFRAFLRALRR